MGNLVIREAEYKDVEILGELDVKCFDDPWSVESFKREIEENSIAFYIVCEFDGKVVGYAGVWFILDEGHITNVAVDPQYRNKGLGAKVVGTLIDFSRQEGIKSFTLEVRKSNIAAQNLYKKFGFKEEGVRPKYYENNGEDALIMWLTEE
ncbi:MAG: ribosomal protein S18-alanine N-acetyltransferase [Anaerovoracaceae bacterium]